MKLIIFIIKLIVIIYVFEKIEILLFRKNNETFEPVGCNSLMSISNSTGKTITTYKDYFKEKDCCLVSKKFNKKKDQFEYVYEKKKECKLTDASNNNQTLFIHGINGWNNKKCKKPDIKDDDYLGSCKRINFECKDFVTRSVCKKYGMEWSDKTCHTPYQKPFKIKERKLQFGSKILKF